MFWILFIEFYLFARSKMQQIQHVHVKQTNREKQEMWEEFMRG